MQAGRADWIAVDDALPEHPSVIWRRRHLPKVVPRYRVSSILSVLELTALGMGVGKAVVFVIAMLAGMGLFEWFEWRARRSQPHAA